jgi:hypothetical protein
MVYCDGFSHVVSNKSTMRVSHTTSHFCVRDNESHTTPAIEGSYASWYITVCKASLNNQCSFP